MITVRRIFFISLSLLGGGIASAQSVFVPLDHQVYPLLVKGETLGLFDSYYMRVLPLTRTEITKLLANMRENKSTLSSADAELLDQMIGEFTDPPIGEQAPPESEPHLYRYEEGNTQMFFDTRAVQEFRFQKGRVGLEDETISETTAFGYLRARFGEHLFIGASARSSMTLGGKDLTSRFEPKEGRVQVVVGKSAFSDQATGYVGLQYGILRFHFGRAHIAWGSAPSKQLGLSARNEPMDLIRFSLDFDRFRFTYFHASLEGLARQRYLVGHRLDVLLGRGVQIGIYETLVYSGRSVEWGYLNPFVPYHFIEHQLGDLDNNMVGIDVATSLGNGIRLFGELFIDDLNWNRSITGHWGNKLAALAGIRWAAPLGIRTVELSASYARVDPWVYTHGDSLNVYVHRGESIGSRLGPNGDGLDLALAWRPHRDWWIEFTYEVVRKGKGDVWMPHRIEDGERKRFLEGTVERAQHLTGRVRYQFLRDIFFGMEGLYTHRGDVQQIAGISANEKFLRLYIDINY